MCIEKEGTSLLSLFIIIYFKLNIFYSVILRTQLIESAVFKSYFYCYRFIEDARIVVRQIYLVGDRLDVRVRNFQGGFLRNA